MGYETRPNDGRVMDIRYNDGRIERTVISSGTIVQLGEKKTLKELIDAYGRQQAN